MNGLDLDFLAIALAYPPTKDDGYRFLDPEDDVFPTDEFWCPDGWTSVDKTVSFTKDPFESIPVDPFLAKLGFFRRKLVDSDTRDAPIRKDLN